MVSDDSPPVSRRRLLAVVASLSLAGCGGQPESDPAGQTPDSRTQTATDRPRDTPTATDSATDTATDEPTATDSDTPTDEQTATATETDGSEPPTFEIGAASWSPPTTPTTGAWPLPAHDARATAAGPTVNAPVGQPSLAWETTFDGSSVGRPLVAGDEVAVLVTGEGAAPSRETAVADPASGEVAWSVTPPGEPTSPPAIDSGELFVVSTTDAVTAFDLRDGTTRQVSVPPARFDRTLLVSGGVAYTTDGAASLHALDVTPGGAAESGTGAVESSPTATDRATATSRSPSSRRVFRFDPGVIEVDAPVANDSQQWRVRDVAVDGERVYAVAAAHDDDQLPADLGAVFALDPANGERPWTARLTPDSDGRPTPARSVTVRGGRVYVTGSERVYAFDSADGSRLWQSSRWDGLRPTLHAVARGTVFLGGSTGVRALDAASGRRRWRRPGFDVFDLAAAGGTLFVLSRSPDSDRASLVALAASGRDLWGVTVDAPVTTITPARGRLYAGTDDGRLLAFE
jgi:outer membrane protein assembly factor BamB